MSRFKTVKLELIFSGQNGSDILLDVDLTIDKESFSWHESDVEGLDRVDDECAFECKRVQRSFRCPLEVAEKISHDNGKVSVGSLCPWTVSFPSQEGHVTIGQAPTEIIIQRWIESLRDELVRIIPVSRVPLDGEQIQEESRLIQHLHPTQRDSLIWCLEIDSPHDHRIGREESQCFHDAPSQIFESFTQRVQR